MPKQKNILVVEDSITGRNQIKKHLANNGYEVTDAANGKEALEIFDRTLFSVVLTDLVMPEMDGGELIEALKRIAPEVIIVVLTSHEQSDLIIQIMKKGVFDYIVKPIRLDKLIITIEKAFHFASLSRIKHREDRESFKRTLISNLHRGFNQGAGIGNQLSIIKMILSQAVYDGENFIIDNKLHSMIKDSERVTDHIIKKIYDLEQILINPIPLSEKTTSDLVSLIKKCSDDLSKFAVINKNSIKLIQPAEGEERKINFNMIYLQAAINEILINAMKFCQPGSEITIAIACQDNELLIDVTNEIPDSSRGIPPECEESIFDPFYRINHFVYESFETMDIGLGLTAVESIVYKHNGTVTLCNMPKNGSNPRNKSVKCLINIPLQ